MTPRTYKSYLLTFLSVVLSFHFADRWALALLLQDIKLDLRLSDTQLGLLTGIAFASLYAVLGVPIARWADRGNRVTIIAASTALWSVAVALSGITTTFLQLMMVRIATAIGEAGCIPTANSLIADYFSRAERPKALSRYWLGAPLAVIIGWFMAGWLNEFFGWRTTFIVLGLPGIALGVLARVTLREPRRGQSSADAESFAPTDIIADEGAASVVVPPTLREVYRGLWGNTTYCRLLLCYVVLSFCSYGLTQWQSVFFIRSYGLGTGELGTWLAIIGGLGAAIGTYLGGELASRYATNNEPLQLKMIAIAYCGYGLAMPLVYSVRNKYVAFSLMMIAGVGVTMTTGPLFAVMQTLVPQRMRATSIAIVYLMANLIGMGLGPLAVGMLSDGFRDRMGQESLRYALVTLCPSILWGGWIAWRASQSVSRDLGCIECEPPQAGS